MEFKDYYRTLGVAREAPADEIRKAFRTLEGLRQMKSGFEWAGAYALAAIVRQKEAFARDQKLAFALERAQHDPIQAHVDLQAPGPLPEGGYFVAHSKTNYALYAVRAFIANGNVGGLAQYLNTTASFTGQAGGLLLNSGEFPQNFFKVNPQFQNVTIDGNPHNSTYHALMLQMTKRLSGGLSFLTTYTWARNIGNINQSAAGSGSTAGPSVTVKGMCGNGREATTGCCCGLR